MQPPLSITSLTLCLKRTIKAIEQEIEKQFQESNDQGKSVSSHLQTIKGNLDEKKQRVKHNQLLAEHFQNGAKDPQGLLNSLIELYERNQSGE